MANNDVEARTPAVAVSPDGGKKKPYTRPIIVSRQRLEAVATECPKGSNLACGLVVFT